MEDALHPSQQKMISIQEYDQYFGRGVHGSVAKPTPARCPLCVRPLGTRGGTRQRHFYHLEDLPCRLKAIHAAPYLGLRDPGDDPNILIVNRTFLLKNWAQIYKKCDEMVPLLDGLKEFKLILDEARRLRLLWYRGLDPALLPFLLVSLLDFSPATGKRHSTQKTPLRKFSFRFFFPSESTDIGDLWINGHLGPTLFRMSYKGSKNYGVTQFAVSSDYQTSIQAWVPSEKQNAWMTEVIASF